MLRRIVVLLVFGSLVLAACGGDDGDGSDEAAGGGGVTTGDGATASTGGDAGGDVGAIDAVRCSEVAAAMAEAAGAAGAAATGGGSDFQSSLDQLEAMADAAPEEIAADLQTIADAYAVFMEIFTSSGWDPQSGTAPPPEVIAELQQASDQLQSEEIQAAVERVNAWFAAECPA